jgi:hypothetical protein
MVSFLFAPFLSGSIAPLVVCNMTMFGRKYSAKLFAWNSSIQQCDQGCFLTQATQAYWANHPSEKAWDCTCDLLLSWPWRSHKRFRTKRLWYINFWPFQTHLSVSFFSGDIDIYLICDVTYEILSNYNPFCNRTPLTISACSLLFWVEKNVVA